MQDGVLSLRMNKCLERVNDQHFWYHGVFSYAMIPRCCPNSRVFFSHCHIYSLCYQLPSPKLKAFTELTVTPSKIVLLMRFLLSPDPRCPCLIVSPLFAPLLLRLTQGQRVSSKGRFGALCTPLAEFRCHVAVVRLREMLQRLP
jgi:hypothetical protein